MDFFADPPEDELLDEELLDEPDSESGEDDGTLDELSSGELEFVELPDVPVQPIEMPWPPTARTNTADFGPILPPVPMPAARDPAVDFSMLIGPGFGEGFAEIPRPRQPRGILPSFPTADSSGQTQRRHDLFFRWGENRPRIEQLPLRPKHDRSFDVSDALLREDNQGPLVQAASDLSESLPVDAPFHPAVTPSPAPGDYKPLGQPRPTAVVQLLDYDQLFLKEQRAFETRLAEVATEIAKREVDHATWVDYIHQRAVFGTR